MVLDDPNSKPIDDLGISFDVQKDLVVKDLDVAEALEAI